MPETDHDVPVSWEWGRMLGKGSYGDVFLAWEAGTEDAFAVKMVRLHRGVGMDKCAEFLKEVGVMRKMGRHKHIVNCVGSMFDERGMLCIVMEYMGGGTLGGYLRSSPLLSPVMCAKSMKQITDGLVHLHKHSIYHRDLKGDNILIKHVYTCGTPLLKIADFGNSKVRETQVRDSVITSFNEARTTAQTVAGTALWMAPEVIRAAKNQEGYSASKSDIWSLGIVACEVLNQGKTPWPAYEHPIQALFDIAQWDGGEDGTSLPPHAPENLETQCKDFLQLCLRVNVQNRPSAATLFQHPYLNKINPEPTGSLVGEGSSYPASAPPDKADEKISDTSRLFPVETPLRLQILCKSAGVDLEAEQQGEKRALAEPDFIETATWTEITTGSVELTPPVSPSRKRRAAAQAEEEEDEDEDADEEDEEDEEEEDDLPVAPEQPGRTAECLTVSSEGESLYNEVDRDDGASSEGLPLDDLAEEEEFLRSMEQEERHQRAHPAAPVVADQDAMDEKLFAEGLDDDDEYDSDINEAGMTVEELLRQQGELEEAMALQEHRRLEQAKADFMVTSTSGETQDLTATEPGSVMGSPMSPSGSLGVLSPGLPPPPVMRRQTVGVQDASVAELNFASAHPGFGRRKKSPSSPESVHSAHHGHAGGAPQVAPAAQPGLVGSFSNVSEEGSPGGTRRSSRLVVGSPPGAAGVSPTSGGRVVSDGEAVLRSPTHRRVGLNGTVGSVKLAVSAFQGGGDPGSPVVARRHSTGPVPGSPTRLSPGGSQGIRTPLDSGVSPATPLQMTRDRRHSLPQFIPTYTKVGDQQQQQQQQLQHHHQLSSSGGRAPPIIPTYRVKEIRRVFESPLSPGARGGSFNPALASRV